MKLNKGQNEKRAREKKCEREIREKKLNLNVKLIRTPVFKSCCRTSPFVLVQRKSKIYIQ
jgi:hypothetical protein